MPTGPTKDLGPCIITWGGTALGSTHGGVRFTFTEEDADVFEDQLGTSPVDKIHVGNECQVEVPLTRMQLSTLSSLLAGASGSGTDSDTVCVKADVGTSRYDRAAELILQPVAANGVADSDTDLYLHIFKASPVAQFELPYDNSGQRTYKVVFTGFPDRSGSGALYRIWQIGAS